MEPTDTCDKKGKLKMPNTDSKTTSTAYDPITLYVHRNERFLELMREHERIAITGFPGVGKTTLARLAENERNVFNTDCWMDLPWEDQPQAIADELREHKRYILEGVQVIRALSRGLQVDCVIFLQPPPDYIPEKKHRGMNAMITSKLGSWRSESDYDCAFEVL